MADRRAAQRVLLIASTGCAMTVLDTNIVAVVLPAVARDLGASFAQVEWVVSAYVLCFAALLLPAGALADRFGRRRVLLGGASLFAMASVLCGAAPTAHALYLARALQGVGAAFLLAPALTVIGHAFHDEAARAKAWATWGAMMGLTMVGAPLLGGLIAYALGWRWAFYVNAPICAALAAAVVRWVPASRDQDARRLDSLGITLFAAAMFGLTWGLIEGQAQGWTSTSALAGFVGGAVSLAAFVGVETHQPRPMLDLALFANPRFIGAVLAMFAYAATAQVMASLLPLYLQNGLGRSPLAAGVAMLPFGLAMLVLPQVGRRLGQRLASFQILALGLAVVSLGDGVIAAAAVQGSWPAVALGMAVLGSGGGLLNGETQKAIMGAAPRQRTGMASGISTTVRFSGILTGFAALSGVLAVRARASLTQDLRHRWPAEAGDVQAFAGRVIAGDVTGALAMLVPAHREAALALAQQSYGQGFSAALRAAAAVAAVASILVILLTQPARQVASIPTPAHSPRNVS